MTTSKRGRTRGGFQEEVCEAVHVAETERVMPADYHFQRWFSANCAANCTVPGIYFLNFKFQIR